MPDNRLISATPTWAPVAGLIFGAVVLVFFMVIVVGAIFGFEVPAAGRFPLVVVLSLASALSGHFLAWDAAAKGRLPLPGAEGYSFTVGLGSAVTILLIVLIIGDQIYLSRAPVVKLESHLLSIVENTKKSNKDRLEAFGQLRREFAGQYYVKFSRRDFSGIELHNLELSNGYFEETNFSKAILYDAQINNSNLVRTNFHKTDIRRVDFRGSQLSGANLSYSKAMGANFRETNIQNTSLVGANCDNAIFDESWLVLGDLRNATFRGASFRNAHIGEPGLETWQLTEVSGAIFDSADIRGADFRGTVGLNKASLIGVIHDEYTKFPAEFSLGKLNTKRVE